MSDEQEELTLEQIEERRLLRSIAGSGRKTHKPIFAKPEPAAAAPEPAPAAPALRDGELPEWKRRQLEREEEARVRLREETLAKEAQIAEAVQRGADTVDSTPVLSPRPVGEEGKRVTQDEKTLINYMQGKERDFGKVSEAAEAERERLQTIFKPQPKSKTNRFAPIAKEAQERLDAAVAAREQEEKEEERKASNEQDERARIVAQRVQESKAALKTALAHYADADQRRELIASALELAVVGELEQLRADPPAYAAKLRQRRALYAGNIVSLPDARGGPPVRLRTNEGANAVDAAIAALGKAAPAPLTHQRALTRAMFEAVRAANGGRPNAVADITSYGKASGSARQIAYRGPVLDAQDIVLSLLIDDGESNRSRRDALLADKFKHFGVAAGTDEDGKYNYCFLLLASFFEEKETSKK